MLNSLQRSDAVRSMQSKLEDIFQLVKSNDPKITSIDLTKYHNLAKEDLQKLEKVLERNNTLGQIFWSEKTQSTHKDYIEAIENKLYNKTIAYRYSPPDLVFGLLSGCAYDDNKEDIDVKFNGEASDIEAEEYNKHLEGWKVQKVLSDSTGYYGVIYVHEANHWLVLAHRGVKLGGITFDSLFKKLFDKNSKDFKNLIKSALIGESVAQQWSALEFTKQAVELASRGNYHLSITGHSLGAWLAELSGYFCHREFGYSQVKVVSFDSPGTLAMMEKFKSNIKSHKTKFNVRNIDITTYLPERPNLINSWNSHAGKVYVMETEEVDLLKPQPQVANSATLGTKKANPFNLPNLLTPRFLSKKEEIFARFNVLQKTMEGMFQDSLKSMVGRFDLKSGTPIEEKCKEMLDWPKIHYIKKDGVSNKLVNLAIEQIPFSDFLPGIVSSVIGGIGSSLVHSLIEDFR